MQAPTESKAAPRAARIALAVLSTGVLALGIAAGCSGRSSVAETQIDGPAPLVVDVDGALAAAKVVPLPKTAPIEQSGLHNVFHLGDRVISGSEPEGDAAFEALAALGVRTIITVDGKTPAVEAAARHGLRYVHIPIRYRGITDPEWLRLSKTFRELDGPFYVHCFHGRHRGPAAAALGRMVLDGVERPVALAEMRQWCGTAEKYGGLYHDIATKPLPTRDETDSLAFDFPARNDLGGYREAMIKIVRASDALKLLAKRGWTADPDHPDVDAINEADKLADYYARAETVADYAERPDDFKRWHRASTEASRSLHRLLVMRRDGETVADDLIDRTFAIVGNNCKNCHSAYRNSR